MKKEGSNSFDRDQLKGYIKEIDHEQDSIDTFQDEYAESCKPHREQIAAILETAKNAGINMKAFRTVLAEHNAERKHKRRVAKLDMMDKADYELMAEALGDYGSTPLGSAALERAKGQEASLDSLS
jgi:uncharacterized protein (UPF0335 family)